MIALPVVVIALWVAGAKSSELAAAAAGSLVEVASLATAQATALSGADAKASELAPVTVG